MYHAHTNSFSMVFSRAYDDAGEMYSYASPPPVDCTLSLGTPSTRLSADNCPAEKKRGSYMSNFGWNILPKSSNGNGNNTASSQAPSASKGHRSSGDPLLARRCANCDTTSTPLWRNGPRGPKSLCNACGIRFKKEERRASAAAAANVSSGGGEAQYIMSSAAAWPGHQHQKSYSSYGSEFRFAENDVVDFTWRFNVTDRSSYVHDFTR